MAQTGNTVTGTAKASEVVIQSRTRMMRAAVENPLTADFVELGRVVPEKMMAFSQAGMAAFGDLYALQLEAWAQWQQMVGLMVSGRFPNFTQLESMTSRTMRMANRSSAAGRKALAPIHRTATSNARRLRANKSA